MTHLKINEVALTHRNVVSNDYQQDSRVLYTFVSNKSFGQLLDISPQNFIFLKILIQNFNILRYGFTDQNSKLLEIEDKKHHQFSY